MSDNPKLPFIQQLNRAIALAKDTGDLELACLLGCIGALYWYGWNGILSQLMIDAYDRCTETLPNEFWEWDDLIQNIEREQ